MRARRASRNRTAPRRTGAALTLALVVGMGVAPASAAPGPEGAVAASIPATPSMTAVPVAGATEEPEEPEDSAGEAPEEAPAEETDPGAPEEDGQDGIEDPQGAQPVVWFLVAVTLAALGLGFYWFAVGNRNRTRR